MNRLIIITNNENVGNWIPDEIEYHTKWCDLVYVFNTDEKISLHDYNNDKIENYKLRRSFFYETHKYITTLFDVDLWKELIDIVKSRKDNGIRKALRAYNMLVVANKYVDQIINICGQDSGDSKTVVYAYWMSLEALVACKLENSGVADTSLTRCHRVDLYEEEDKNNYLEFRNKLMSDIDYICPISDDGVTYINKKYGRTKDVIISRLGTVRADTSPQYKRDDNLFRIVSCSRIAKVKRVDFIVDTLNCIRKDIKIEWHHFGDGPESGLLIDKAKTLSDNVTFVLEGQMSHELVLEKYISESYDLFINVSSSEGIPVSIMEAMSFGIPVLALDVGGVAEAVDSSHGALCSLSSSASDLAKEIERIVDLSEEEYDQLRLKSFEKWQAKYDASVNYELFSNEVLKKLYGI